MSFKVLFVCAENTCRSQMAEGFARQLGFDADSAGIKAGVAVNPAAIKVMAEVGIDVSAQSSKSITAPEISRRLASRRLASRLLSSGTGETDTDPPVSPYDAIVSLCSVNTSAFCPAAYAGIQLNWNIEDPWGSPCLLFGVFGMKSGRRLLNWRGPAEKPRPNSL